MQALNYTPKAIEQFDGFGQTATPLARHGFRFLAEKLRQAEVFILPEFGQLLDRDRARPEASGTIFKPLYPAVALEYAAPAGRGVEAAPTEAPSSRRIALAWEWSAAEFPAVLLGMMPTLRPGVAIASIAYDDATATWLPIAAAVHYPYEASWIEPSPALESVRAGMIRSGRIDHSLAGTKTFPGTLVPIMPEVLMQLVVALGPDGLFNAMASDLLDETNAYFDLAYMLACGLARPQRQPAPERLNRQRERAGKPPLKDFHFLTIEAQA